MFVCLFFSNVAYAFKEDIMEYINKNWETVAPGILMYKDHIPKYKHEEIAIAARNYYFGKKEISTDEESVKTLTALVSDGAFLVKYIKAAKLQARINKSPVWVYYYGYKAASSYADSIASRSVNLGNFKCMEISQKIFFLLGNVEHSIILFYIITFSLVCLSNLEPLLFAQFSFSMYF